MTELNSIDDAFHLSESQVIEIVDFFQSGRFPTTEEYIKWDLWSKTFYLKVHSSCGNKPPLSYQSLGQQQEVTLTYGISSEEEEEEEEEPLTDGTSSDEVHKMPPRMRGRGRGQGAYVAPNDHEAGPSHRRTPSGSHNTDAQNLWRSFTEPARHSVSQSTSPSIPHSFGPQSENEPHNSHKSYIPLQGHQSPFDQPSPVFQGLFNPADYLDVPMGFNPLGPEDHFPGDNAMEVDEDTDPSMPPSGTPNHPIEISDGSPFVGSPYNGPDSFEERFRQHD
ncbi:hypothetical protein HanHA89_Chr04g0163931 [Helianthus annuus]|nr:hypothetical protein HanHA89_Chr04g0163931 [Helianthus annuus]